MRYQEYHLLPHCMGGMECSLYDIHRHLKHHDFGEVHHLYAIQPYGIYWDVSAHLPNPEPGDPCPVPPPDKDGVIWRESLKGLAERGHYFKFWGSFACREKPGGFEFYRCEFTAEEHEWMLRNCGEHFLGYDMGEIDGVYQRDALPFLKQPARSRREAFRRWRDYQARLKAVLYDYVVMMCALTFPHYYAEMGARMLGQEMGQGLPNCQVTGSFLRGATRQYGLDFEVCVSGWDRWGFRNYMMTEGEHGQGGPWRGHGVDFQRRVWYLCWLCGAALVFAEAGHYASEVINGVRQLSPVGQAYEQFVRWARTAPRLPEMWRPLALVLDHGSGWAPPHHLYSSQPFQVWCGGWPYEKGDFAVHSTYELFYPGYEVASLYRDERGFIVPTPHGDAVDALLANAPTGVLERYPVAWLCGPTEISADQAQNLAAYVERGGILVLSSANLNRALGRALGVRAHPKTAAAEYSIWLASGQEVREERYLYSEPLGEGRRPVAATEQGVCSVAEFRRGRGRVICIGAEYGLTDTLELPGAPESRPPFELLNVVKRLLRDLVRERMWLEVEGPPVHWVLNGDGTPGSLVALFNHTDDVWQGQMSLRGGKEIVWKDLLTAEHLRGVGDARVEVGPRDFRILQVTDPAV